MHSLILFVVVASKLDREFCNFFSGLLRAHVVDWHENEIVGKSSGVRLLWHGLHQIGGRHLVHARHRRLSWIILNRARFEYVRVLV